MSRILRGAWSRRGSLATLVAMTLVVVAGTVAVLQFAAAADLSRLLTAPLLLIGAVAVPSIGAELAVARREEIGLARLRGIHGVRLWSFLLTEPLLAIALGAVAGVAVGAATTAFATRTWLDEGAPDLGRTSLLAAAVIAVVGLLIVALSGAAALREPLAAQVSARRRPRRSTTLAIFASILVIAGAGVAAYRSRVGGGEPDLVVLLGPALVGLALGQVAIWVVRIAARGLTPVTEQRGLGAFLAARRLARADELVSPLRLVVAAAVVGTLALSGSAAVTAWTDDQAAIEVPGARTIDATDLGGVGALDLTQTVDPDGTHLMATAIMRNEERLTERRAYVDAQRWDAVAGQAYDGTPASAAAADVPKLRTDLTPLRVVGDRLTVRATATTLPPPQQLTAPDGTVFGVTSDNTLEVGVSYVTTDDESGSLSIDFRFGDEGVPLTRSVRVRECAQGCIITGLEASRSLNGLLSTDEFAVMLNEVTLGDVDLTRQAWVPDPASLESARNSRYFVAGLESRVLINRPDGLAISLLPDTPLRLRAAALSEPVPILSVGEAEPLALDIGGDDRPSTVLKTSALESGTTLPLLGTIGTLADLSTAVAWSTPTVPSAEVQIVARAGTDEAMLAQVAKATGTKWRSIASVRSALGERHGGAQSVAYALTALACALVALLALGAGVARHLRDYRRDVASLRVLGVPMATARRAGRTELLSLVILVLVVVVAGGWLAVRMLLGGLPLLRLPVAAVPVDTSPHLWPLAIPAVLAAAAVFVVGGRARAVRALTTQPSLLREEETR